MPARRLVPPAPKDIDAPPVAVCYTRVSYVGERGKPGAAGEFLSPELQSDPARALCQYRGWKLDEALSSACADLDESAYRKHWRKRPGIVAFLDAARAGRFQWLIVLTISRLA